MLRLFAPTTIKNWLVWFLTVILGSSSKGKRLEFPVTLKLLVNRLGGSWIDAGLEAMDPIIACAWAESRIVRLSSRWFNLAQTLPDSASVHGWTVGIVWLVSAWPIETEGPAEIIIVAIVKNESATPNPFRAGKVAARFSELY